VYVDFSFVENFDDYSLSLIILYRTAARAQPPKHAIR